MCPGYDTKQSDGEALVMLDIWGMRSIPSLPSLTDPLWPRVVAPDRILSMGQIERNCILMLNWIVWNRTVLCIKKREMAMELSSFCHHSAGVSYAKYVDQFKKSQYLNTDFQGRQFFLSEISHLVVGAYSILTVPSAEEWDVSKNRGVLSIILNRIWWWGSSSRDLGSVGCTFITIIPKSTLIPVW